MFDANKLFGNGRDDPDKASKDEEGSLDIDSVVQRDEEGIITTHFLKEIKANEKKKLQNSLKRLVRDMHPEIPRDLSLEVPPEHAPMNPTVLLNKISYKHKGILEKCVNPQPKKKSMKKRGAMIRRGLNAENEGKMQSRHKILKNSEVPQFYEASQSNISRILQGNNHFQNSNLNNSDVRSMGTSKDDEISKRISIYMTGTDETNKVKPESALKNMFNFTVATSMNYQKMKKDRSFLNGQLEMSEEKRKQTILGRFVSNVDHTDLFQKKDYFETTDSFLKTWRMSSLRGQSEGNRKTKTNWRRSRTATSTNPFKTTMSTTAGTSGGFKLSNLNDSKIGSEAVNENNRVISIRKSFLNNYSNGLQEKNDQLERDFYLGFEWMTKKKYLDLENFDDVTLEKFINKDQINNKLVQQIETQKANIRIHEGFKQSEKSTKKAREYAEMIEEYPLKELQSIPGYSPQGRKSFRNPQRVSFSETNNSIRGHTFDKTNKQRFGSRKESMERVDVKMGSQDTASRHSNVGSILIAGVPRESLRKIDIEVFKGNKTTYHHTPRHSRVQNPKRVSMKQKVILPLPPVPRILMAEASRDTGRTLDIEITMNQVLFKTEERLKKIGNTNKDHLLMKEEKLNNLKKKFVVMETDSELKRSIQSKLINNGLGVKQSDFQKVRKDAENVRSHNYRSETFHKCVEMYNLMLSYIRKKTKYIKTGGFLIRGVFLYLKALLLEGVFWDHNDLSSINSYVEEMQSRGIGLQVVEQVILNDLSNFISSLHFGKIYE